MIIPSPEGNSFTQCGVSFCGCWWERKKMWFLTAVMFIFLWLLLFCPSNSFSFKTSMKCVWEKRMGAMGVAAREKHQDFMQLSSTSHFPLFPLSQRVCMSPFCLRLLYLFDWAASFQTLWIFLDIRSKWELLKKKKLALYSPQKETVLKYICFVLTNCCNVFFFLIYCAISFSLVSLTSVVSVSH